MTHGEIVASIEAAGGRLVASFVLDERGRTVGAPSEARRAHHCSACGETGHTIRRCNGVGKAPRDPYEQTRRILAAQAAQRQAARQR